jgi:hypothetical protein
MKLFELGNLGEFLSSILEVEDEGPFSIHMSKNEEEKVIFVLRDPKNEVVAKGFPNNIIGLLKGQGVTILQKYDKSEVADFFDWWWNNEDLELTMGGKENFLKAFDYWEQKK